MSAVLLLLLLAALFTINKENTKVMDVELSDPNLVIVPFFIK